MNQIATTETRAVSVQQQIRDDLTKMGDQFVKALPEHIKPERFQRIVLTAVLSDPALLGADRKTLLEAAMRAAQDGLLPDKREGAFVVFGRQVQWMPMIGGIIKKMHQSGEIAMLTAKVVYGGDTFRAWVDDAGEHVAYEQAEHPDFDTIRQVFALAKTKDGAVYVETLTPRDIEKIRSVSRSKDKGPWVQWWEEMAKKSAIRRLAKRLPLSADLHDLIQRDNDLYDLSNAPDPRPALGDRLRVARSEGESPSPREGFDHAFVTAETAAITGAIEPEHEPSASPSADEGSGATANPQTDRAAAPEPADAADQGAGDAVEGLQSASPASTGLSEADRTWLVTAANMLIPCAGPGDDPAIIRRQYAGLIKDPSLTPKTISDAAFEKAIALCKHLVAVSNSEVEMNLDLIAGIVGCDVSALSAGNGRG